MNREDIERVVFGSVAELNASLPEKKRLPAAADTRLIGEGGRLDSIGLVDLILSVEQGINEAGGGALTIADEKAFSQAQSPFLSLGSLTDYVTSLVNAGVQKADG